MATKSKRRPPRIIGPMSDAMHQAVTSELVRLSLSGRPNRPELRVG